MKAKARAVKIARRPAQKAPAKKKPAAKAAARRPRAGATARKALLRTPTAGPRTTARKAPLGKARATKDTRRPTVVATKKPVRAVTKERTAARPPRSNGRVPVVRELTQRQGWAMFDREARKYTGMTGKEFIEWWNRGVFEKDPDDIPGVMDVAMLLPFVEES